MKYSFRLSVVINTVEVYFKPKPNEILDGDRTITLTHKVATATGQFASFDGATLKASVSVTLTDNDKGALKLVRYL